MVVKVHALLMWTNLNLYADKFEIIYIGFFLDTLNFGTLNVTIIKKNILTIIKLVNLYLKKTYNFTLDYI